jgi:hypothetical protein
MATETSLEQRLTAVEQAVSELQQRLAHLPTATNWLARITGSFKDEPAFEEVLALGRASVRQTDRMMRPMHQREIPSGHGSPQYFSAPNGARV